jgi:hypothetical protein
LLFRNSFSISPRVKGRDPTRPKIAICPPVSSTARSRSSPLDSASAGEGVFAHAINSGVGFGEKPYRPGLSGLVSCSTLMPFRPSAT